MAGDRTILRPDQIRRYSNTTAYWDAHATIIPKKDDIYIYEDVQVTDKDGNTVTTPMIKIGTGREYLGNLPFVGQYTMERLESHIADNGRHVNPGERDRWNNKLNINDFAIDDDTIIFNRN